MSTLQKVKIYPSVGIARIGNSPEWYLGPELPFPAPPPTPPNGKYKDAQCRIKRQGQRFYLWGYFSDGTNRELTLADGVIQWNVHLANTKTSLTNEGSIDPGPRTLNGANDVATFANGNFLGVEVPLGEAHTDAEGHLIVVGGFGNSGTPNNSPLVFPNSRGWYDDVSDGPVTAQITIGGTTLAAEGGAWVICPPPRYAPTNYSITSLYDTIRQVGLDNGSLQLPAQPSFANDIYPILKRALDMRFVTAFAFGTGDHDTLAALVPPGPGQLALRQMVFNKLRPAGDMPLLFDASEVKPFQRTFLQQWSLGQSIDDWPPVMSAAITPEALNQAALESCVGAAFYPGIEATSNVTTIQYVEPFRVNQSTTQPGDLTKGMSRPWQNDFFLCSGATGEDQSSWWPAARPIGIYAESDPDTKQLWTRGLINSSQDMVDSWNRLGFIVDTGLGKPVETERTVVCKSCFFVTDRSEIGKEEAQALIDSNQAIVDAFYVVVEGFAPSDIGISTASPSAGQLQQWAPAIALAPPPSGLSVQPSELLLESNGALNQVQRITFGFDIRFTSTADFTAELVPLTLTATVSGVSAVAVIELTTQPNPYLVDGAVSWLSNDVRVFKAQPGASPIAGVVAGNDPNAYIKGVINNLRNVLPAAQAFAEFEGLPSGEAASELEWLPSVNNAPVYNFALARVRYRATVTSATAVRVFFRLFQTAATGTDFDASTTYRVSGQPGVKIPVLGIQGGELITIPFFAEPRQPAGNPLNAQVDPTNVHDILPAQNGQEAYAYFGCWLDINQPSDLRFPIQPSPPDGGPFVGTLKSIADLIRGTHQCMVAEIDFDAEPITPGAATASSDKLAQRNLAIDHSDNPGSPATHRVQHTFTIRPGTTTAGTRLHPDELMIDWGNTPAGSTATLYLPGLRSAEILGLCGRYFDLQVMELVDDHTLRCRTAGVTYLPIPGGGAVDLAGLITLDLPTGIQSGQVFRIVVRQVVDGVPAGPNPGPVAAKLPLPLARGASGAATVGRPRMVSRRIRGAFQFSVQVQTRSEILPRDERTLISLHRVLASIPLENRWYPVMLRYVSQLGARIHALGGGRGEGGLDGGRGEGGDGERCSHRHAGRKAEGQTHLRYEGKISGLSFDRFGDFEGFRLDTEDGERFLHSREKEIETLVRAAWTGRIPLMVIVEGEDRDMPLSIVLLRPPAGY